MLVDLGRNDLGRVCEIGSIHLTEEMEIQKISACHAYCFEG